MKNLLKRVVITDETRQDASRYIFAIHNNDYERLDDASTSCRLSWIHTIRLDREYLMRIDVRVVSVPVTLPHFDTFDAAARFLDISPEVTYYIMRQYHNLDFNRIKELQDFFGENGYKPEEIELALNETPTQTV